MAKKVRAIVKLQIVGGKANPAPPVGPALGQHGVNIMEFCKAYNAPTQDKIEHGHPRGDHGLRGPFLHFRPQDPAGRGAHPQGGRHRQGCGNPRKDKVGKITSDQLRQIAEVKMPDLNANDVDAAMNILAGTARSMGVTVVD